MDQLKLLHTKDERNIVTKTRKPKAKRFSPIKTKRNFPPGRGSNEIDSVAYARQFCQLNNLTYADKTPDTY